MKFKSVRWDPFDQSVESSELINRTHAMLAAQFVDDVVWQSESKAMRKMSTCRERMQNIFSKSQRAQGDDGPSNAERK